jgi:hypothetical protein
VVRERPVGLEEVGHRVDRQSLEHGWQHHTGHAVGGVDHDAQRLHGARVDEGHDSLDPARPDVFFADRSFGTCPLPGTGRPPPDVQQAGVASHRERAAANDLHARVLLRVVRRRHHHAAVQPELSDREIDHLRSDHADIRNVGTGLRRSAHEGRGHVRRREAHVTADGNRPRLELLDVGTPDCLGALFVELLRIDPAHVVRLEDLGVEHGPDASGNLSRLPGVSPS